MDGVRGRLGRAAADAARIGALYAGAIDAAHIPVVAALILWANHREVPRPLRASWPVTIATGAAGSFFAVFAVLYVAGIGG